MKIQEIFYSFQGEGIFIGYPQVFVRFFGCNLVCDYCDEIGNIIPVDRSVDDVAEEIRRFFVKKIHSIAITGGEPLLQVDELKELILLLKKPIFLETNGTLPENLAEVKDLIDYFSVDYKIGFEDEFMDFISLIADKPNVFVKYVMIKDFDIMDLQKGAKIIASFDKKMPFIIQPVTPNKKVKKPTWNDISRGFNVVSKYLDEVRVIGQGHKLIGIK